MSAARDRTVADLRRIVGDLYGELAERTAERDEGLAREAAMAAVLGVINSSPGDLVPVFQAILQKAHTLCEASFGALLTYDGERFHAVAHQGTPALFREFLASGIRPGPGDPFWRIVQGAALSYIQDLSEVAAQYPGAPLPRAAVDLGGIRTLLVVPLRKDSELLGVITAYRREVRPFTDKQIALLQNFAAQAVIAMENARLLTETREALEQQTAAAEVLQVINNSPGDLTPVFDAILEKAHTLCDATQGTLAIYDGEYFRAVAMRGVAEPFAERLRQGIRGRNNPVTEPLIVGDRFVLIPDALATSDPALLAANKLTGTRTLLSVPLRKDGALLGMIVAFRQEVRPFSDKEIALLQSFAAQAVIAMENARLLTETREALEQQTATAEVLQIINASPEDLAPVFDAMLEKAMRLCEASFGYLLIYDGEGFLPVADRGHPAFAAWVREQGRIVPEPGTINARIVDGEAVVQVADVVEDPFYRGDTEMGRAVLEIGRFRTVLTVALRKNRALRGIIHVYRQEVRPFDDRQVALLQNFAEQAVVAMENARLLNETREALEHRTATAEVLEVINSSPGDLVPVFDVMLDKALGLCEAAFGILLVRDADRFRTAASHGVPPGLAEFLSLTLREPGKGTAVGRMLDGEDFVQFVDMAAEAAYRAGDARQRAFVELGGTRSYLAVALRKDGELVGTIGAYRQEVRPFTDKQIALLQNFAAQAVIAMENARLLDEIRTARDTAEEALAELRSTQQQLVVQQKMAALGQLTAGIAHEIRNPLNFVNNFAGLSVELLGELKAAAEPVIKTLDEDTREEIGETFELLTGNLDKIVEHGLRADGIVQSMLAHSRGTSAEPQKVDINALLAEALNLAYHGARAQDENFNITLEREFDDAAAPVELVPKDVQRVFLNLIGNGFYAVTKRAREAGAGFRPALKVTTRDEGDAVVVRVRDNGIGIGPEIRDKLFQPFFTTKPTGEGTGLGLSISYDIITTQHGGTITVDSEEGAYTEFTLRLPRRLRSGRSVDAA